MKNMRNSVQIIGNVGKMPEVKELAGGNLVARFSIATHEKIRNGEGLKQNTQWHQVVAWGTKAKYISKYLDKGSIVAIDGKLVCRAWKDAQGNSRKTTEIWLNEVMIPTPKQLKPVNG